MKDNLQDAYKEDAPDFIFSYHNALKELFEKYLLFLQLPITHYYKFYCYLSSVKSRKKYLQEKFIDKVFGNIMIKAIVETKKSKMLNYYEQLTDHVLTRMGGFNIDGWQLRSKLGK